jgi:glutathione S-transferase
MPNVPPVVLRYFDCRGRAQFIRYYFACRELEHTDERVALSPGFEAWQAIRNDRARAGAFHKLPVLHWGDRLLSETLVIKAFLHRVSGDEELLSDGESSQHAMLASSIYNDLMTPIGMLIWADLMFNGVDLGNLARQYLARIRTHLASLDRTLEEWDWCRVAAKRPIMLVDCLLWEELDVAQHVFGEHIRLHEFATLSRAYQESAGRATFERLLASRPASITGRGLASEADMLAQIRTLVAVPG